MIVPVLFRRAVGKSCTIKLVYIAIRYAVPTTTIDADIDTTFVNALTCTSVIIL